MPRVLAPSAFALLLLAFLLAASPAGAEGPVPIAAAATRLPAPSADQGFVLEGEVRMGGVAGGTFHVSAELVGAGTPDARWKFVERFAIGGGAQKLDGESWVSPGFVLLEGTERHTEGPTVKTYAWKRGPGGLEVTSTVGSASPTTASVPWEGPGVLGAAPCLLWFRLVAGTTETVATPYFEAEPEDGRTYREDATLAMAGEVEWEGRKALQGRGTRTDRALVAWLDPETKAPLGFDIVVGGRAIQFRTAGSPPDPDAPTIDFAAPATTPEAAALRAALAFATADMALVEETFDWPALHAASGETHVSTEEWKQAVLAKLEASLQKNPREMVEGALRMAVPELATADAGDGRVRVTFPAMFQSLQLVVGKSGEHWRLVEMPKAP
jgi:hypothetical protein